MRISHVNFVGGATVPVAAVPAPTEHTLEFERRRGNGAFGLSVKNAVGDFCKIGYDADTNAYFSDRTNAGPDEVSENFAQAVHRAPRRGQGATIKMRIPVDASSIELLADGGETTMTERVFPSKPFEAAAIFATGARVTVVPAEASSLQSA